MAEPRVGSSQGRFGKVNRAPPKASSLSISRPGPPSLNAIELWGFDTSKEYIDEASILSNDFPAGFPTSSEEIKDVNDTKKKMNIDKNATTQPPSPRKPPSTAELWGKEETPTFIERLSPSRDLIQSGENSFPINTSDRQEQEKEEKDEKGEEKDEEIMESSSSNKIINQINNGEELYNDDEKSQLDEDMSSLGDVTPIDSSTLFNTNIRDVDLNMLDHHHFHHSGDEEEGRSKELKDKSIRSRITHKSIYPTTPKKDGGGGGGDIGVGVGFTEAFVATSPSMINNTNKKIDNNNNDNNNENGDDDASELEEQECYYENMQNGYRNQAEEELLYVKTCSLKFENILKSSPPGTRTVAECLEGVKLLRSVPGSSLAGFPTKKIMELVQRLVLKYVCSPLRKNKEANEEIYEKNSVPVYPVSLFQPNDDSIGFCLLLRTTTSSSTSSATSSSSIIDIYRNSYVTSNANFNHHSHFNLSENNGVNNGGGGDVEFMDIADVVVRKTTFGDVLQPEITEFEYHNTLMKDDNYKDQKEQEDKIHNNIHSEEKEEDEKDEFINENNKDIEMKDSNWWKTQKRNVLDDDEINYDDDDDDDIWGSYGILAKVRSVGVFQTFGEDGLEFNGYNDDVENGENGENRWGVPSHRHSFFGILNSDALIAVLPLADYVSLISDNDVVDNKEEEEEINHSSDNMIQYYAIHKNINPRVSSSIFQQTQIQNDHSSNNQDSTDQLITEKKLKEKKKLQLSIKNKLYKFDWLRSVHHKYMCEQRCLLLMEKTSPFNMMNPNTRRWLASQCEERYFEPGAKLTNPGIPIRILLLIEHGIVNKSYPTSTSNNFSNNDKVLKKLNNHRGIIYDKTSIGVHEIVNGEDSFNYLLKANEKVNRNHNFNHYLNNTINTTTHYMNMNTGKMTTQRIDSPPQEYGHEYVHDENNGVYVFAVRKSSFVSAFRNSGMLKKHLVTRDNIPGKVQWKIPRSVIMMEWTNKEAAAYESMLGNRNYAENTRPIIESNVSSILKDSVEGFNHDMFREGELVNDDDVKNDDGIDVNNEGVDGHHKHHKHKHHKGEHKHHHHHHHHHRSSEVKDNEDENNPISSNDGNEIVLDIEKKEEKLITPNYVDNENNNQQGERGSEKEEIMLNMGINYAGDDDDDSDNDFDDLSSKSNPNSANFHNDHQNDNDIEKEARIKEILEKEYNEYQYKNNHQAKNQAKNQVIGIGGGILQGVNNNNHRRNSLKECSNPKSPGVSGYADNSRIQPLMRRRSSSFFPSTIQVQESLQNLNTNTSKLFSSSFKNNMNNNEDINMKMNDKDNKMLANSSLPNSPIMKRQGGGDCNSPMMQSSGGGGEGGGTNGALPSILKKRLSTLSSTAMPLSPVNQDKYTQYYNEIELNNKLNNNSNNNKDDQMGDIDSASYVSTLFTSTSTSSSVSTETQSLLSLSKSCLQRRQSANIKVDFKNKNISGWSSQGQGQMKDSLRNNQFNKYKASSYGINKRSSTNSSIWQNNNNKFASPNSPTGYMKSNGEFVVSSNGYNGVNSSSNQGQKVIRKHSKAENVRLQYLMKNLGSLNYTN